MNAALILASLILIVGAPTPALAYMDPGSGSMLLQALLAGTAGAAVFLRLFWKRLKDFLGRGPGPDARKR